MWVATVDFMKAFDSISHQSSWTSLEKCGIEPQYISLLRRPWKCEISWAKKYISATRNSWDQNRIRVAWASFHRYQQELTSRLCFLQYRLRFFNLAITPDAELHWSEFSSCRRWRRSVVWMLSYASGTWTLSREHERMIRSTQREMLRFIVQSKKKQEENSPVKKVKRKPQKIWWRNNRGQQF